MDFHFEDYCGKCIGWNVLYACILNGLFVRFSLPLDWLGRFWHYTELRGLKPQQLYHLAVVHLSGQWEPGGGVRGLPAGLQREHLSQWAPVCRLHSTAPPPASTHHTPHTHSLITLLWTQLAYMAWQDTPRFRYYDYWVIISCVLTVTQSEETALHAYLCLNKNITVWEIGALHRSVVLCFFDTFCLSLSITLP